MPAVVGTAPVMDRHLILHVNHEASTWPSHLESTSELYRELGKRTSKKLKGLGFNVSDAAMSVQGTRRGQVSWDPARSRFEPPMEGQDEK